MKLLNSTLAFSVLLTPALAQGSDECVGATPLISGVPMAYNTSGATASAEMWGCVDQAPDRWFEYTTVGNSGNLVFETCGASYDSALEVFSGTCGSLVLEECNDDFCGRSSSITLAVAPVAGQTFLIRVGGWGGDTGAGAILAIESDAPDCATPDVLETNFDCASATPVGDGSYLGLNVQESDNDYYLATIPTGGTIEVSIGFAATFGDVDLLLWDPAVECDTEIVGQGGAYLARSNTTNPTESISYTNGTGAPLDVVIEIDMFTSFACNDYDMEISGVGTFTGPIGSAYCMANANSTGSASEITATGSTAAASNDVTLTASGLPTFSFGFFIVSDQTAFVPNPAGSAGNLCVGGDVGRYVAPGQVMSSLGAGSITLGIDLASVPRPNGSAGTAPGDTWHFQLWHRDGGATGPTSNFTNGRTILFN